MCIHLTFKYETATQALNYLAGKSGGTLNKLKALKLIFFADRYHLRKYGRPVTGDEYLAMPYGPVASSVKDIAEMSSFLDPKVSSYAKQYVSPINKFTFRSMAPVDTDQLSESDIEALNFAWNNFGAIGKYELAELTHAYPEWKRHESALKHIANVRMDYLDFLGDPPANCDPCFALTDDDKAVVADMLKEKSEIARLILG